MTYRHLQQAGEREREREREDRMSLCTSNSTAAAAVMVCYKAGACCSKYKGHCSW